MKNSKEFLNNIILVLIQKTKNEPFIKKSISKISYMRTDSHFLFFFHYSNGEIPIDIENILNFNVLIQNI